MAKQPTRNKATSPSRNKGGGGGSKKAKASSKGAKAKTKTRRQRKTDAPKKAVTPTEDAPLDRKRPPHRAERQGTRRIHSRELTEAEAKERQEADAKRREEEIAAHDEHRKGLQSRQDEAGGWGALRRGRGQVREE